MHISVCNTIKNLLLEKNYNIIILVTSEEEVRLNGLKNKSGGSDEIHAYTLKLVAPYIASILARIINNSFQEGTCPSHFKTADVCPVLKNGSKKEINNYRFISLISNLAKVFEKILSC